MREIGAPFARRTYGVRARMGVVLYAVDPDRGLWGFTLEDTRQQPLARSVAPRRDVPGLHLQAALDHIETLTGVKIEQRDGERGFIRADAELTVTARTLDGPGEIGFRSDVL